MVLCFISITPRIYYKSCVYILCFLDYSLFQVVSTLLPLLLLVKSV